MIEVAVNVFRANIKSLVDNALSDHVPIRVRRRAGKDFIVMSAEDWERDQETLYVLQSSSLSHQIAESLNTYKTGAGYTPSEEELNEIDRI